MNKESLKKANVLIKEISDLEKVVSGMNYMIRRYRIQSFILSIKNFLDKKDSVAVMKVPDICAEVGIPITADTANILYKLLNELLEKKKEEFNSINLDKE